jgi:hypothetical protein
MGNKLRTGQTRRQNEAFTSDLVVACCHVAEGLWDEMGTEEEREKLEELMAFMLLEFGAALRGEEVPLVSLAGMLAFWEECITNEHPHIMVTLKGRFKGEAGHRWHCVPVSVANRSGIPFKLWIARLLHRRVVIQNRTTGPLFISFTGRLCRIRDMDPHLIELLDRVRDAYPKIISKSIDTSDFSLWRSGRRGATTEAMNRNIDGDTMDLVGRWRKRESARGTEPGLPMRHVYTQVRHVTNRMLVYSSAL